MITNNDIIEVWFGNKRVGSLALTPNSLCAFEYDAEFIKNGFSISPFFLPLKSGVFISKREPFNGLFGVFNDSLPDGWGMLLTDRLLKQKNISLSEITILDRLAIVGDGAMGGLSYKPAWKSNLVLSNFDLNEIAKEVELVLHDEYHGNIEELFIKGGSSGGARPKILVSIKDEEWLIKFKSSNDPDNIGEIEYQYSKSAINSGIEMTETKLFEDKYFGIKRFDRDREYRYHTHSASGLLHASYRYPSLDYIDLMKATFAITRNMKEVGKVYRQMVFNILTSNMDDHAKNFSFIYKNNGWELTPAYDLVLSNGFNGQHTTTVAGKGNPTKIDIFEVAKQIGISSKKAELIFNEVYSNTRNLLRYIPKSSPCLKI